MTDNLVVGIKSGFDDTQKNAHELVRDLLWILYPTDATTVDGQSPLDDTVSDSNAAMIIDGIAQRFKLISIKGAYVPLASVD